MPKLTLPKLNLPRLTLQRRLFVSHLLVLLLGFLSFITIRRLSFTYLFSLHLNALEAQGILLRSARSALLDGFDSARNQSSLLALGIGVLASATLSYWTARRINHSLVSIEKVAYRFATGNLHDRVAMSPIPELARLGRSLNQMASALEGAELRRRNMVTDLSHELRTPLTVIRGYLEDIDSAHLQETPEIRQLLITETRRLERLVSGLQDLSKAESGSLSLTLQAVILPQLLEDLAERFSSQLSEDGPVLELVCPADLPPIWADCDRTEQILINLLGNAMRHTQKGRILIEAKAKHNKIWVSVHDTGSGISPADLPHVFDRFWRSEQARSLYSSGTGIGLTITRQLIRLQGGEIEVESTLGQGSVFRFWLPVAKE